MTFILTVASTPTETYEINGFNCLDIGPGIEFPEICDANGDASLTLSDIEGLNPTRRENCLVLINDSLPFIGCCDADRDDLTEMPQSTEVRDVHY